MDHALSGRAAWSYRHRTRKRRHPTSAQECTDAQEQFSREITQAQPGEAYHLELDLEITDDDGRARRHTVTVRGPVSTFMLPARGVQSITMDPDHALLIWTPEYGPRP